MRAGVKEVCEAAAPAASDAPAEEPAAESPAAGCRNCGAALAGEFCQACGERRPDGRDLSLRHFAGEAAREFASLEHSKLLRTLGALLFRPGLLTREYFEGRRGRYLKPLSLFLAALALNFLAHSYAGPYTAGQMIREVKSPGLSGTARYYEREAARKGISTDEFVTRVSEKLQVYGGLAAVNVFNALLFALLLLLVMPRAGRYFVEHLVFSMHFVSFSTLTVVLLWPVYFFIGIRQGGYNYALAAVVWSVNIAYMYFAVRAVYGLRPLRTLLASLLLIAGYFVCYMVILMTALVAAMVSVGLSK